MIFIGPVLGPLVSGFILQCGVSWRWIIWVMMIFAGICCLNVIIFLPETYAPIILSKKAKRLRKQNPVVNKELYAEHELQDWSAKAVLEKSIWRPIHMLYVEPILLLITIYISIVYGLLYGCKLLPFSFFPWH